MSAFDDFIKHQAGLESTLDIGSLVSSAGSMTLGALGALAKLTTRWAVGIPVGVGAGLGYLSSKITSPSVNDVKVTEKMLEQARIKTMITENERRRRLRDLQLLGE